MKTAKEKLEKLREHNIALYKGDQVGPMKKAEVQEAYSDNMAEFAKEVTLTRQGKQKDRYGRTLPAVDISFGAALTDFFGIVAPDKNEIGVKLSAREREVFVIRQFMKQNDVHFGSDSLATTAQRFGHDNLNAVELESLLIKHSSFDGLNNTTQVPGDYRFIIPELIMAAIRLDYEGASQHTNWISSTVSISQRKVTMPQILRGNTGIRKINEAESIPYGTVRFGQKDAKVYKIGTGFKITDELIEASTLDMLFEFMGQVGIDMAIGADVEAAGILLNGEQADLSESAPVVGVTTVNQFKYRDLRKVCARMIRLKYAPQRVITGEDDGIDLTLLEEFKGFAGDTKLGDLQSILGVPATLINDVFVMPSNQIMLLDPRNAMVKLMYRGMKTERRRNPQTQEEEMFVSDYIGFAIKRRDARVVIDKSLAYGSPDNASFPAYMDVDARIAEGFKTVNE